MNRRNGFTLIELVVVILILGILAGVAAPKMFNTSAKARDNGLKQSLAIVRDAIELFHSQTGALPVGPEGTFKSSLKNYLRGPFPRNPVTEDEVVKVITAATTTADNTSDWLYNSQTGEFIANSTDAMATDSSIQYNEL